LGIDSDRFSSLERGSTATLTTQQVNRTTPQGLVSEAAWRFIGQGMFEIKVIHGEITIPCLALS
jgi:hypothetical protein